MLDKIILHKLLDQEALEGIGNIYKSESLFLAGLHPFEPVGALGEADLRRVVAHARRQMARNATTAFRRTASEVAPESGSVKNARWWSVRNVSACGPQVRARFTYE